MNTYSYYLRVACPLVFFLAAQASWADSNLTVLLNSLARDADPLVRESVAFSLRSHAGTDRADLALERILANPREKESVRAQAAKTLSLSPRPSAYNALLRVAGNSNESVALREIALKALYRGASVDERARRLLRRIMNDHTEDSQIRRAVAWGFFLASTTDQDTSIFLLGYAVNAPQTPDRRAGGNVPDELRKEALKSLFLATGKTRVLDIVLEIAVNSRKKYSSELQRLAILCLQRRNETPRVKAVLTRLAAQAKDPAIRAISISALELNTSESTARFFHTHTYFNGLKRDPFEE